MKLDRLAEIEQLACSNMSIRGQEIVLELTFEIRRLRKLATAVFIEPDHIECLACEGKSWVEFRDKLLG